MAFKLAAAAAVSAALLAAPAFAQEPDLSGVSTAIEAANAAGLADAIASTDGMTVFVPSNDAISAGPQDAISSLLADPEQLSSVITYYAIPAKLMAADVISQAEAEGGSIMPETVNGETLTISVMDGNVMIEGATGATATVVTPDIEIGNVVLHVVDGLVLPEAPDAMSGDSGSTDSMSDTSSDDSSTDSSTTTN